MPGPKEATPDQCQRFLQLLINELLRLWQGGVRIVTPKYPQGRLVRLALVAVVCDKPAAHKIGGSGSHGHTPSPAQCSGYARISRRLHKHSRRMVSLLIISSTSSI